MAAMSDLEISAYQISLAPFFFMCVVVFIGVLLLNSIFISNSSFPRLIVVMNMNRSFMVVSFL